MTARRHVFIFIVAVMVASSHPRASAAPPTVATHARGPGPAGSLVMVEESQSIPLVQVALAARTGSAGDPRHQEGLINLAAELARHGAAGRTRAQLDDAIDVLGATLDVIVEPDSVRLAGQVLARNLRPFLEILADIVLRPTFDAQELGRTRREILGQIDEMRNDDRALVGRFFVRRLFRDHPYGRAPDGTAASLGRIRRGDVAGHFKRTFVGKNLIFAAAGAVSLDAFRQLVATTFRGLRAGTRPKAAPWRRPASPDGWRVQIVNKPDRRQTQIMFGHLGPSAADPDFLPLAVAMTSFGGGGMKSTLMDEARTRRGLVYGASMSLVPRRGPGLLAGWASTGAEKTVTTLKLMLRLYKQLAKSGIADDRLKFFQQFMTGSFASDMDEPGRRLAARVNGEMEGLPEDFVDTYRDRIMALTPAEVAAAIKKHITPDHLIITMVATADTMMKTLVAAKVSEGAIDVVDYQSY